jgi:tagatose-6-phosphate ketose/aldose isomerase
LAHSLVDQWLADLGGSATALTALLEPPFDTQLQRGYGHTLREIAQQPVTWQATAALMSRSTASLVALLKNSVAAARKGMPRGQIVLTGSGSSVYIGECLALPLQSALRLPVQAFPSGLLLTHSAACLLPDVPGLVISFGRSGNSPESAATVDLLLKNAPAIRHLLITCNRDGRLATAYPADPRVLTLTLDDRTHDRSLVMTSSFTNMWLAARVLGLLDAPRSYARLVSRLENLARHVLSSRATDLARIAHVGCRRAVFLGTGPRHGSARESALKILEMTAGRIVSFAESFLGLRHGPVSGLDRETLVVAFLASDPIVRAFEVDVLRELNQKRLGGIRVIVGESIPRELLSRDDVAVDCPGLRVLGDENAPPVDVLVGQLLGLFYSLELGLSPDNPSPAGVIQRVVQGFAIHTPQP